MLARWKVLERFQSGVQVDLGKANSNITRCRPLQRHTLPTGRNPQFVGSPNERGLVVQKVTGDRHIEPVTPDDPCQGKQPADLPQPQLWAARQGKPIGFADLFLL